MERTESVWNWIRSLKWAVSLYGFITKCPIDSNFLKKSGRSLAMEKIRIPSRADRIGQTCLQEWVALVRRPWSKWDWLRFLWGRKEDWSKFLQEWVGLDKEVGRIVKHFVESDRIGQNSFIKTPSRSDKIGPECSRVGRNG